MLLDLQKTVINDTDAGPGDSGRFIWQPDHHFTRAMVLIENCRNQRCREKLRDGEYLWRSQRGFDAMFDSQTG